MALIILILYQIMQSLLMVVIAPIFVGWVRQNRAWLNNKSGAGVLQPYRELRKLFIKRPLLAENASWLFRAMPYFYFSIFILVTAIIPLLSTQLLFAPVADAIALVGLFAFARIGLALAAMDIGTAFGSLGARREMFVAFLTEPALLLIFFNVALMSQSTSLAVVAQTVLTQPMPVHASLVFSGVAFVMVLLAENARIPIDNPTTHLELTMIHEAMILEYSGRHLALIEWGSSLKLLTYFVLGIVLFFPWGITTHISILSLFLAFWFLLIKLLLLGSGLALFEILSAKLRLFRAPEFLTVAFLLAIVGVFTQTLMWK